MNPILNYYEKLTFDLVVSSTYVMEMIEAHYKPYLSDIIELYPPRIKNIDTIINPKDPECESGFIIAKLLSTEKEGKLIGYQPLITFQDNTLDGFCVGQISHSTEVFESFIHTFVHEFQHLAQFYEVCRRMGSNELGVRIYNELNMYLIEKYPWPFTPLELDAINAMHSIDPFRDHYNGHIYELIDKLIDEYFNYEE